MRRRNRMVWSAAAVLLLMIAGARFVHEHGRKAEAQAKLDWAERFMIVDRRETGAFWGCVMGGEVDAGMLLSAEQLQQRIEAATPARLTDECVPKLQRSRQLVDQLGDTPAELAGAVGTYKATLPRLQAGVQGYVEQVRGRLGIADFSRLMIQAGEAWHAEPEPNAVALSYERFLGCAVPSSARMKDVQALLMHLHEACFRKDAAAFVGEVQARCGELITNPSMNAPAPKRWGPFRKRLHESEARQLRAWESCLARAGKSRKASELEELMAVVGDHMQARAEFAQAARGIETAAQ